MVQKNTSIEAVEQRLVLPDKSATSSVLNGIGNGMMLTGLPLVAAEFYFPTRKDIPRNFKIGSMIAMVVGAVVGGLYGKKEADEITNYRQALRSEITHLHKRIDAQHAPAERWTDVVKSEGSDISR